MHHLAKPSPNVLTTLALLLLLAALATPSHGAGSHFLGSWEGEIVDKDQGAVIAQREMTVHSIVDGTVYGWYCVRENTRAQLHINDFHGDGSGHGQSAARATAQRLTTTIRDYRLSATVNRDGDSMAVAAKTRKRTKRLELRRTELANAPCRPRIVPLPAPGVSDDDRPPGNTFADLIEAANTPDAHPFIGFWTGKRANGLVIELNVLSVTEGAVTGLYCNTWSSGWRASDMDPQIPGAIAAIATDTKLTFRHERNGREFDFTLKGPDTMTYIQTIPDKGRDTVDMVRTNEPICATRVIAPTT